MLITFFCLFITFCLFLISVALVSRTCEIDIERRYPCGWWMISQSNCETLLGCCFDYSAKGMKRCFYSGFQKGMVNIFSSVPTGRLKHIVILNSLSANPTKRSNTLKQFVGKLPTNCLSVFDHFVKLAQKGLIRIYPAASSLIKPIFQRKRKEKDQKSKNSSHDILNLETIWY